MPDSVIQVEQLSKLYRLKHKSAERHGTFREMLTSRVASLLGRSRRIQGAAGAEDFWALRDVSFEVMQGEVMGIIGRNGAGKSTLLKILSRITEPTKGRITLQGRVASLLEVGTGFHPELTGRENIFLNGAILGMTKTEIRQKFDEIVAFAEVEKFLDTPVKRYSSGMYVRLAFAVAAHLDPEILIVDEVLSVGDAQFQKKCLGKMNDVARKGRTVLLVSHDLANIARLCTKALLLAEGRVVMQDAAEAVIARYSSELLPKGDGRLNLESGVDRSGTGEGQFRSLELSVGDAPGAACFPFRSSVTVRMQVRVNEPIKEARVALLISTHTGTPVHDVWNTDGGLAWDAEPGEHEFTVKFPELLLYPGAYTIDLWLGDSKLRRVDYVRRAAVFEVTPSGPAMPERPLLPANGVVFLQSNWQHESKASSATLLEAASS